MPAPDATVAELSRSLDWMHDLLRRGDLAALPDAAATMESDLAALAVPGKAPPPETELAELRRKLERNAACLLGAARGIRAARRRIAEVRAAATGLGAYDASGQRVSGAVEAPRLARRF